MDTMLRFVRAFLSPVDRLPIALFRIVIRSGLMGRSMAKHISVLLLILLIGTTLAYR